MRKIRFRGYNRRAGEWFYGNLLQFDGGACVINDITVDPITVGQYTGYDDCEGTPMYEGDIVKIKESVEATVEWSGGGFHFYGLEDVRGRRPDYLPSLSNRMRVIGSIYDTPDLLNGK